MLLVPTVESRICGDDSPKLPLHCTGDRRQSSRAVGSDHVFSTWRGASWAFENLSHSSAMMKDSLKSPDHIRTLDQFEPANFVVHVRAYLVGVT